MPTFQNYATLSYNGQTAVSNLVTGEIVASLRMTKTAVVDTYAPGGRITYALSILNSGESELSGLSLTDDLGTYTHGEATLTPLRYVEDSARCYINGELQGELTVTAGPPLSITGLSVPAGGNTVILYTAEATAYAPMCSGGQIVNNAELSGAGIAESLKASASAAPECGVELNITKSVNPAVVTENGEITYTFQITNLGSQAAEAGDNVSVTDVFDPVLRELTVTLDGQELAAGQYTYNQADGSFATVPGVITVPAADFAQDPDSGMWTRSPGGTTLTVCGRI